MELRPPRVQFEKICKRYPGVQALDEVSFSVAPGSIHAIVGENGAGKSTLMKVLGGGTPAEAGAIRLDGEDAQIASARHALGLGIAVVYQEFNLVPELSVGENVFLGRWPRGRLGLISRRALRLRTDTLFRTLGVVMPTGRKVAGLNVGQQQMVEIARALSLDARVLVLDEPSAVLTPSELAALFALARKLASRGVSVLYISHRLDEIFELADTVTVLRDGRHISTRSVSTVTREALIREMVGRSIDQEFPPRSAPIGPPALRVESLSARGRFCDVSLDIRGGEVFALTGLVGSGRSSLGKALFGVLPATGGRLQVGTAVGPFPSPKEAQRAGIAYLPEDRKRQGLLLHRPLYENITLAHLADVSRAGVLNRRREQSLARTKMAELRIRARGPGAATATLSGGNQQKVMIARWLQRRYALIILDEPTRGVDVGARVEIYGLINRMAAEGAAVLMITSDLPEALGMADRIGVMTRGRLTGVLDNRARGVTQEMVLRLAVGEC